MIRDQETLTTSAKILLHLLNVKTVAEDIFSYPSIQKAFYRDYYQYHKDRRMEQTLRRLIKQGWIKTEYKEAKKFISLTNKGELEALFHQAKIQKPGQWDEQWRIVMFDIPEGAREVRQKLRLLLLAFGFKCLQASVYIYPYALSGAAIAALRKSKLIRYIRMARADFDDDTDLRKLFKLPVRNLSGRLNLEHGENNA